MAEKIANIRKSYSQKKLSETKVNPDPLKQFAKWWKQAIKSEMEEVNAMTLATASNDGMPSARIVLLKDFGEKGFVFLQTIIVLKASNCLRIPKPVLFFSGRNWKDRFALPAL